MKKILIIAVVVLAVCLHIPAAPAGEQSAKDDPGEKLFTQQCAVCHPQGGNIINPRKTLSKKILAANNIKTEEDIIKVIRNGAAGMTKFDAAAITDADAKMIARYILNTFK
jgi:cytochrome c6